MTSFTISSDGINVQRLKGVNRTPGTASAISPIAPSRGLHKTAGAPKMPLALKVRQRIEQRRFTRRRRRLERRVLNRRNRIIDILLDTRSHHERRISVQRAINRTKRNRIWQSGIDIIV
jgi:hypothetical protein